MLASQPTEGAAALAAAVGGHNPLFQTHDLRFTHRRSPLAVGALGLDILSEQHTAPSLPVLQRIEDQLAVLRRGLDLGDGVVVAVDDPGGQLVLHLLLDGAAEVSGAIGHGVGLLH